MSDLKDKILNILFEDEEGDNQKTIAEETTLEDIEKIKEKFKTGATKVPDAKELLYGASDKKSSSFIDYFEPINLNTSSKVKEPEIEVDEKYELRNNISPIFGTIASKEKKKKPIQEKEIQKATTQTTAYTGIVLSPIFGYDDSKANVARSFFEQDDYEDEEPAFDIPDMNEANLKVAKDAMSEAVVELGVGIRSEEEGLSSKISQKQTQEIKEEPIVTHEPEVVQEVSEDMIEEIPQEVKQEPVIENTTKIKIQEIQSQEPTFKANRSIYDSQPIKLFDFDTVSKEDETTKDLFDELVGEDR